MHDFVTESKDWVDTTIVHLPTLIHRFLLLVAHAKVPKSMKILVEVTGLNEEWEWEWHGVIGKCVCHFDRHCFDGIVKSYFRELCIKVKKKGLEFLGDSDAITLSHFTVKVNTEHPNSDRNRLLCFVGISYIGAFEEPRHSFGLLCQR